VIVYSDEKLFDETKFCFLQLLFYDNVCTRDFGHTERPFADAGRAIVDRPTCGGNKNKVLM